MCSLRDIHADELTSVKGCSSLRLFLLSDTFCPSDMTFSVVDGS
jgi:hypothetical protein